MAFVGAQLAGGTIRTPWGMIRKPTAAESDVPVEMPFAPGAGVILLRDVPFEVAVVEHPTGSEVLENPLQAAAARVGASLQHVADMVSLSFLLALNREHRVAPIHVWTLIDNPLGVAGHSWPMGFMPVPSQALTPDDHRRVHRWAERINGRYHKRIEIAVKRTLASYTRRLDPADRLIDAIVALENLFGAGSGELKFRISSGCAFLLERKAAERPGLQKEIGRLYDRRSDIVHGSSPRDDVHSDARAAGELAVRSLQTLFTKRPDLISAKDRTRLLIFPDA
ncbi:MAG: hypothetical protein ACRDLK_11380 [Gaiellaceae bacterium]